MTRAEKNIWQSTAAFEPLRDDQNGLIPRKKPAAKNDDGLMSEKVGTTRRLLNFLSSVSGVGKPGFGDDSMTASRKSIGRAVRVAVVADVDDQGRNLLDDFAEAERDEVDFLVELVQALIGGFGFGL